APYPSGRKTPRARHHREPCFTGATRARRAARMHVAGFVALALLCAVTRANAWPPSKIDDPPGGGGGLDCPIDPAPAPPANIDCAALCPGVSPTDEVIDVRACNAMGDGSDETSKLQCAAYYAAGKVLVIPKGHVYVVSNAVNVW